MCVGDVGSKKAMAVAHRRGVDLIVPQDDGLVKQDAWSVSDGETGGSGPDVVSACVCADQVLVVLSTGRLVLLRFLCREDACCLVRDASPSLGEALHPQGETQEGRIWRRQSNVS